MLQRIYIPHLYNIYDIIVLLHIELAYGSVLFVCYGRLVWPAIDSGVWLYTHIKKMVSVGIKNTKSD